MARLRVSLKFWGGVLAPVIFFIAIWFFAAEIFPKNFSKDPEMIVATNDKSVDLPAKGTLLPPRPHAENPSLENWERENAED